jgi:hypothetical protein
MAAENGTRGKSGGVLCRVAATRFKGKNRSTQGRIAKRRSVNFLFDTNAVSERTNPRPDAGLSEGLSATAAVHRLTLVTHSVDDFCPSLEVVVSPWTS